MLIPSKKERRALAENTNEAKKPVRITWPFKNTREPFAITNSHQNQIDYSLPDTNVDYTIRRHFWQIRQPASRSQAELCLPNSDSWTQRDPSLFGQAPSPSHQIMEILASCPDRLATLRSLCANDCAPTQGEPQHAGPMSDHLCFHLYRPGIDSWLSAEG
jgi:hypothetical protein